MQRTTIIKIKQNPLNKKCICNCCCPSVFSGIYHFRIYTDPFVSNLKCLFFYSRFNLRTLNPKGIASVRCGEYYTKLNC